MTGLALVSEKLNITPFIGLDLKSYTYTNDKLLIKFEVEAIN